MDDIFDIIEDAIEGAGSDTDVKNPNKEQGVQDDLFYSYDVHNDNYDWCAEYENMPRETIFTTTYAAINDAQILKAMNDCASIYEQIEESQENTYGFSSAFYELQRDVQHLELRVEALHDATRELMDRVVELEAEVKQQ